MARSQTWTRNINKKDKKVRTPDLSRPARSIVDDGALDALKRRAEDWGLIVHARPEKPSKTGGGKRGGAKRGSGR